MRNYPTYQQVVDYENALVELIDAVLSDDNMSTHAKEAVRVLQRYMATDAHDLSPATVVARTETYKLMADWTLNGVA